VTLTPEAVIRKLFERIAEDNTNEIRSLLDPDVVWFGTRGGLDENRVLRGADAFLAYREKIEKTWEKLSVEVERIVATDDTVVALLLEAARGRGALEVHNETAAIFKVRAGRIVEGRGYFDREEAFRVAELQK
jgi:ketosteroid isomerase-like protein